MIKINIKLMKNIFLTILTIFFLQTVDAQRLTPSVISSGGSVSATGNIYYSFTVGELFTPVSRNQYVLTQGFEQPASITIKKIEQQDSLTQNIKLRAFPNPTKSVVNINITSKNEIQNLEILVFDITGKQINLPVEKNNSTNYNNIKLNFQNQQAGQYFIRIYINENMYFYKIIKN